MLPVIERGLLLLGVLLLVVFSLARIHRFMMFRTEMSRFEAKQVESTKEGKAGEKALSGEGHI